MSFDAAAGDERFDVAYLVLSGTTTSARCPELLRGLVELGFATIIAIPTPNASRVIAPRELADVEGVQVVESYFDKAIRPRPPCGVVLFAPCSFNSLNKLAHGIADSLALSVVAEAIGRGTPVIVGPSLNAPLLNHPQAQASLKTLPRWGVIVVPPVDEGRGAAPRCVRNAARRRSPVRRSPLTPLAESPAPRPLRTGKELVVENERSVMDSNELRELQAPLKQKYREDPSAALVTLTARGGLGEGAIACKVETGRALVRAGLHPATGGDGLDACSGDMLLEALVACAGVTLKAVATALGLDLRGGTVSAEGDLDFRGTLGVDQGRAGRVPRHPPRLRRSTPTRPQDQLESLLKLTERYCVVLQTLRAPPKLTASL